MKDIVDLSEYLCESLPVLKDEDGLKKLEERLKNVHQQEWEATRRCYEPGVAPDRGEARDAAAQLAFSLARGTIDLSANKIRTKVSNGSKTDGEGSAGVIDSGYWDDGDY